MILCVIQFHLLYVSVSIHDTMQYVIQTQSNGQNAETLACTQTCIFRVDNVFNTYNYEHTLSKAIHRISNVSLLQEKDTQKLTTVTLYLIYLQYPKPKPRRCRSQIDADFQHQRLYHRSSITLLFQPWIRGKISNASRLHVLLSVAE
jgi:hypothetical protein